jgi:crotonobetaine/carnitine-CoA ligase
VIRSSDGVVTEHKGVTQHGVSALTKPAAPPPAPAKPIQPFDTQSIIYTSGTTGRSKGALSSYMHAFSCVGPDAWNCLTPHDRQMVHMPIFHIGGAFIATVSLCVGSSIGVVSHFRTEAFWDQVRELEITSAFLLGAMATFLLKQPPSPRDRDHKLRMVFIVPLGQSGWPFRERFGVDFYTLFNMTEICTPLISRANPVKDNICGRPRAGVEVRLVDEYDCTVEDGKVGQLILRTEAPWAMNHGYNANPQATGDAWRNGWFHTGDAFFRDADGDYHFVDRLKDAIRRRGENISSYEIEVELLSHPAVREAAAIPVPSETSEDEVLVVLAAAAGASIEPEEIVRHLQARVAHHMIPRYVRIIDELPKTPTAKVEKHVLRAQGVTDDTWDRERAGISIRREKL